MGGPHRCNDRGPSLHPLAMTGLHSPGRRRLPLSRPDGYVGAITTLADYFAHNHKLPKRWHDVEPEPAATVAGYAPCVDQKGRLMREDTAPGVTGIHHISLTVSDIEASAAWYQRLLGAVRIPMKFDH